MGKGVWARNNLRLRLALFDPEEMDVIAHTKPLNFMEKPKKGQVSHETTAMKGAK